MVSKSASTPLRILLVEDDEHDVLAFRRAFQKSQVASEITHYVRAEKALERLVADASSFDLVVADYKLPGMSGLKLCKALLDREVPLPLVLLTGAGTEHLAVEALKAGVDDYLIKDPSQGYLDLLPVVLPDVVRRHGERLARKRAEEALKESLEQTEQAKQEWESTADSLPSLICLLDDRGRIIRANRTVEHWNLGLVVDVKGQGMHELLHPGCTDPACYLETFWPWACKELAQSRPAECETEDRILKRYLSVQVRPITAQTNGEGKKAASFAVAVVHDITERKRAEETLAQQAEELARSNAELERFAYVASHDLQEPLRMVTSHLKLLEGGYKGRLDSTADEFIAHAVDGATRMQAMIKDLLAYSRVGMWDVDFEPTDCEAVFERTLADLQVAIEESGALVTHDPLPTLMADDLQLGQLFQNLIGNAIKFCSEEPPRVHVSAQRLPLPQAGEGRGGGGDKWVFSVRDNGIGIDPEYTDCIFEIFQRLHTQEEYPGTGIGLATCKKIVDRHGGRIWVESQPGKGSTFYFTISA